MFIDETTHIASQLYVSCLRSLQSNRKVEPSFAYRLSEFHGGLQLETDKPSLQVIRARSTAKVLHERTKPFRAEIRLDQGFVSVLERLSALSDTLLVEIPVSDAD